MKEIVLAGGCFWGVEEFISRINGVIETKVGYANGAKENPSYEEVCTENTGHAEACYVRYDQTILNLQKLLREFWSIIDPTVINRQGYDMGSQYRTGIFYLDKNDLNTIIESKNEEQKNHKKTIVTEVEELKCFYKAAEYHQKYLKKNPEGYCHIHLD